MDSDFGFGGPPGFGPPPLFQFAFTAIIVIIIGVFVFIVGRGLLTWSRNNAADRLTRPALIVAKRTKVWGGSGQSSASTSYYMTFEFEDGERLELGLNGNEFGLLVEGDHGTLTYQGTRFIGFTRN